MKRLVLMLSKLFGFLIFLYLMVLGMLLFMNQMAKQFIGVYAMPWVVVPYAAIGFLTLILLLVWKFDPDDKLRDETEDWVFDDQNDNWIYVASAFCLLVLIMIPVVVLAIRFG